MRKSILLAAILAVIPVALSCTEETPEKASSAGETVSLTVTGILGEYSPDQYATKASLVNNIRVAWENGDEILVFDSWSRKYLGSLLSKIKDNDNREAILYGDVAAPEGPELIFLFGTDLHPGQYVVGQAYNDVTVSLKEQGDKTPFLVYGIAKLSGHSYSDLVVHFNFASSIVCTYIDGLPAKESVDSIAIANLSTQCAFNIVDLTVEGKNSGTIIKKATGMRTNKLGQLYVEIAVAPTSPSTRTATISAGDLDYRSEFTGGAETEFIGGPYLEKGKSYASLMTMTRYKSRVVPDGCFPHYFSVAPGKVVRFSKGNLKCLKVVIPIPAATVWIWSFFDEQYKYGPGTYENGHYIEKSLFSWSDSSTTPDFENYPSTSTFSDWGATVDLIYGGNWRTLTIDEWKYLLQERGTDIKHIRTNVTVCGRAHCVVIAPDGNDVDIVGSYNSETWAKAESDGFVCLPPAGRRAGKEILAVDESGFYWSSTMGVNNQHAYCVYFSPYFYSDSFDTSYTGNGYSVRLVTED